MRHFGCPQGVEPQLWILALNLAEERLVEVDAEARVHTALQQ